ncbi:MAG TPA: outer membrane protein transport protein [Myxococcota bacterium]|nr:outer membrane protein transport protein [Myxococcota bacterium]
MHPNSKSSALVLLTALLLGGADTLAGGFLMYEHGATATGMADARTALADDVNALYFNPAAICELEGLQLELGVTGVLPYVSYQAAKQPDPERTYTRYASGGVVQVNDGMHDTDAKLKGFSPIHVYAAYRIPGAFVSIGFGLNNPFGLGTYWPGDWDGRFITTESEITTFVNQPVVAVDLAGLLGFKDRLKLSLAVGYDLVYGTARMAQRIDLRIAEILPAAEPIVDPEGSMLLVGSAIGHGYNFALYAELPGLLAFGASVRSGISLPFSGTARFSFNQAGQDALLLTNTHIPDATTGRVTVNLPWNMNFGLAFLGVDRLKLALDLYLAFFQSYDELQMKFDCLEENPPCDLKLDPIKAHWGTAWQLSLGAEYRIWRGLSLRGGYASSFSPVPADTLEPSVPDSRQDNISLGAGFRGSGWKVDLGYMLGFWSVVKDNDVGSWDPSGNPLGKANGKYTTVAHLLALSVSAWF